MDKYSDIRATLYEAVMEAVAVDLIRAAAGNISVRTDDGHVAITPSSIKYRALKPSEIAIVDLDGNHLDGPHKASSETPMHTAILRACPHVNAICHTHSLYAMTFAVLGQEIPMVTTELFVCGAPIPVAPWASPGSAAGGTVCVEILNERPDLKGLLLRNHGVVAVGETLREALDSAYDVEIGAQVYHQARQIGEPRVISAAQRQDIIDTNYVTV